jgi:TatD DNase family protein
VPVALFDTHAHIDFPEYEGDAEGVLRRAAAEGVRALVNIGTDAASSRRSIELARRFPQVWAAVGVHPHDSAGGAAAAIAEVARLLDEPRVVALGEFGLDHFKDYAPRADQEQACRAQLRLAQDRGVPMVIHCRDAHGAFLDLLRSEGIASVRGVMHCWSGGPAELDRFLELGFHVSLAGPVTYPNAARLREAAARVPDDRLLLETDCPFLAPQPVRGKRNEPAFVRFTAEKVAELRGRTLEELAALTTGNACRFFGIPLPPAG